MYQFRQLHDQQLTFNITKIERNISEKENEFYYQGLHGAYWAWVFGALKALYGEPVEYQNHVLNAAILNEQREYFQIPARRLLDELVAQPQRIDFIQKYIVETTNDNNNPMVFVLYSDWDGLALACNTSSPILDDIVHELQTQIDNTPPIDYEVTFFHTVYGMTITYGCNKGKCYYYREYGKKVRAERDQVESDFQAALRKMEMFRNSSYKADFCVCKGSRICLHCKGAGYIKEVSGYDEEGQQRYYPPPYRICPSCDGSKACQVCLKYTETKE